MFSCIWKIAWTTQKNKCLFYILFDILKQIKPQKVIKLFYIITGQVFFLYIHNVGITTVLGIFKNISESGEDRYQHI